MTAMPALELHTQDPMLPREAILRKISWETDDTFTLTLDVPEGTPSFLPGQFNMVYVYGVGEAALSISSDPANRKTLAHTVHRVGIVTSSLSRCRRGDTVGIRGPYGASWPLAPSAGRDVLVIAGGIGLAPLRPLLYQLFRSRHQYGRIMVLYGARTPLDLLYRVELERWANENNAEIIVTVDRGDTSWKGYVGVVTTLFSYIKIDAPATIAYLCGPETMMKFTLDELERRGVPPDHVYLSMERNMKCGIAMCGHCQYGPFLVCRDGPVFHLPRVRHLLERREL